jgi:hypothetical protein
MYRLLRTAALLACIPCTLPAQAPAATPTAAVPVPSVELPAELARVLTDYETLYRTGGMKLAELFTDDGFVLSGGRPPIRGRPGIAEYYDGRAGRSRFARWPMPRRVMSGTSSAGTPTRRGTRTSGSSRSRCARAATDGG